MIVRALPGAISLLMAITGLARGSIPALNVPGLPDTAMTVMTSVGPVILENPDALRAAGAASAFVRAHEYAHVLYGHLDHPRLLTTDEGRAQAEAEADCFAARTSSIEAVTAMVQQLLHRPPEPRDAIYGTKPARVHRILACAGRLEG